MRSRMSFVSTSIITAALIVAGPGAAIADAPLSDATLARMFRASPKLTALGGHLIPHSIQIFHSESEVCLIADLDLGDRRVHRVVAGGSGPLMEQFEFTIFEGDASIFKETEGTGVLVVSDLDRRYPSETVTLYRGVVIAHSSEATARPEGIYDASGFLCDTCKWASSRGGKRCPAFCDYLSWPYCCYCYMALCAYTAS